MLCGSLVFYNQKARRAMNYFGNYQPQMQDGEPVIEPTLFVVVNWPLFCQIAEIAPVPKIKVILGAKPDFVSETDTAAMFYQPDTGEVVLNDTDLKIDAHVFRFSKLNIMGFLWGIPATMIRAVLANEGRIEASQRLTLVTARRAGWPKKLVQLLQQNVGPNDGSENFEKRCDVLLIQSAVQNYVQTLRADMDLDQQVLHDIVWSKRETVNLELFKIRSK